MQRADWEAPCTSDPKLIDLSALVQTSAACGAPTCTERTSLLTVMQAGRACAGITPRAQVQQLSSMTWITYEKALDEMKSKCHRTPPEIQGESCASQAGAHLLHPQMAVGHHGGPCELAVLVLLLGVVHDGPVDVCPMTPVSAADCARGIACPP